MIYEVETYHYLLIHFPIALFIVGYLFATLNYFNRNDFYEKVGDLNMFLGVVFGILTIISGFITDNILIGHMENPFPIWSTHGTHMIVSIILFFGLLLLKYYNKCVNCIFYVHTLVLIFFIHGAHIGAKLADRL